jgi:hypothetical protein
MSSPSATLCGLPATDSPSTKVPFLLPRCWITATRVTSAESQKNRRSFPRLRPLESAIVIVAQEHRISRPVRQGGCDEVPRSTRPDLPGPAPARAVACGRRLRERPSRNSPESGDLHGSSGRDGHGRRPAGDNARRLEIAAQGQEHDDPDRKRGFHSEDDPARSPHLRRRLAEFHRHPGGRLWWGLRGRLFFQ